MQDKAIELFQKYADQFGRNAVLHYIQEQTDIAPIVAEGWIDGKRTPSSGIQKAIFHCLRNARHEDFRQEPEPPRIVVKTAATKPASPKSSSLRHAIVQHNDQELETIRKDLRHRGLILEEVE